MDPTTGTFLAPDPLMAPATSRVLSAYLHAADEPTVLWDPSEMSSDADSSDRGSLDVSLQHRAAQRQRDDANEA